VSSFVLLKGQEILAGEYGRGKRRDSYPNFHLSPFTPSLITHQIKSKNMKIEDRIHYLKPLMSLSTMSKEMSKGAL
jgi:hypothetical protein